MTVHRTGAPSPRRRRARSGLWAPALVSLGLGVPAGMPLHLAWWLLTE
ncbi:hypothetical protein ACFOWE_00210 [Planomonospora corallina]|uniref:Uncharacterized protein n=1 Tax=Planomonospora corallina TaxID=1806052 RepID=A0ABV8HXV9_9ACTN